MNPARPCPSPSRMPTQEGGKSRSAWWRPIRPGRRRGRTGRGTVASAPFVCRMYVGCQALWWWRGFRALRRGARGRCFWRDRGVSGVLGPIRARMARRRSGRFGRTGQIVRKGSESEICVRAPGTRFRGEFGLSPGGRGRVGGAQAGRDGHEMRADSYPVTVQRPCFHGVSGPVVRNVAQFTRRDRPRRLDRPRARPLPPELLA